MDVVQTKSRSDWRSSRSLVNAGGSEGLDAYRLIRAMWDNSRELRYRGLSSMDLVQADPVEVSTTVREQRKQEVS